MSRGKLIYGMRAAFHNAWPCDRIHRCVGFYWNSPTPRELGHWPGRTVLAGTHS